jgi:ATP-dependent DNA helicase RecG
VKERDETARTMDDMYYKQQIIAYLRQTDKGTKKEFIELLGEKLPSNLSAKQKDDKIRNMLSSLRREGRIVNIAPNKRSAVWGLAESAK